MVIPPRVAQDPAHVGARVGDDRQAGAGQDLEPARGGDRRQDLARRRDGELDARTAPGVAPSASASRSNSVTEKWGVPSATASIGPSGAVDRPAPRRREGRRCRRRRGPARDRGRGPSSRSGASGVRPTAWNSATDPDDAAGRAERLEVVLGGGGGQPDDRRDPAGGQAPEREAKGTVARHVGQGRRGVRIELDDQGREARLRTMQPGVRHAAGDRRGDVAEVAVARGPGAEDRVDEDDRVRLRPGHVLADGPGGPAPGTARRSASAGSRAAGSRRPVAARRPRSPRRRGRATGGAGRAPRR